MMPRMMPDLLTCWTCLCGKKAQAEIWGSIPSCGVFGERNLHTFEGKEHSIIQLKSQFVGASC